MRAIGHLAAVSATLALACGDGAFGCQESTQCGDGGVCEAVGYCSFPDDDCASGRRFGELAGDFAGMCVLPDDGTDTEPAAPTTTGPSTDDTTGSPDTTGDPVTTTPLDDSGSSTGTPAATMTGSDTGSSSTTAGSTEDATSDTGSDSSSGGGVVDPDLLLWFTFEEELTTDSSGYDRHATCNPGECPVATLGVGGTAASFDGIDDLLTIAYDDALSLDELTISVWVQPADNTTGNDSAFGKGFADDSDNSYQVYYQSSTGEMVLNMNAGTMGAAGGPLGVGWHHVAGTYDGSTTLELWIDGQLIESISDVLPPAYDETPVTIGGDLNGGVPALLWLGEVDDVRLYSRVLTPEEIGQLAVSPE